MATHDPDEGPGSMDAAPDPDRMAVSPNQSSAEALAGGAVRASQIPPDVADTPGAVDGLTLIPTQGTPAPGDPGGAAAGGAMPAGPNPVIGTPHAPHIEVPHGVIHSINAVPGESNPAMHDPNAAGPPTTTAAFLEAREDAEAAWQRSGAGVQPAQYDAAGGVVEPYEDSEGNVLPDAEQAGGRPNFSGVSEVTPLEYMESPHSYSSLPGAGGALDATDARLDAKAEANANAIEHAESVSGVTFREAGNYEHREFETSAPERDDIMSGAGTGMGTQVPGTILTLSAIFATLDQAQTTVQQLLDIGIAPGDIALLARHEDGGSVAADTATVTSAGEDTVRRSADELPNDEDLPTTVADQTDTPADEMAGTPRAGLSADEGSIPRVDAPADPDIYTDFASSDADYRTTAATGAAQVGGPAPADADDVPVTHVTARSGAVVGGLAGLLTGLAALAIPGIGPIIAAGPIAGALVGLVAGTLGGGLLGALLDAGVPEEQAHAFAGRVAAGEVLLTVRTDRVTRPAVHHILAANGAADIHG